MADSTTRTFAIKDVVVVDERPKAINCHWGDDGIDHWLARSELCAGTTVQHIGDRGSVVIPRWLAERARIVNGTRDFSR